MWMSRMSFDTDWCPGMSRIQQLTAKIVPALARVAGKLWSRCTLRENVHSSTLPDLCRGWKTIVSTTINWSFSEDGAPQL